MERGEVRRSRSASNGHLRSNPSHGLTVLILDMLTRIQVLYIENKRRFAWQAKVYFLFFCGRGLPLKAARSIPWDQRGFQSIGWSKGTVNVSRLTLIPFSIHIQILRQLICYNSQDITVKQWEIIDGISSNEPHGD